MQSVRTAVLYSVGQRYLAFALQLATSVILARLLTPEQTGVYSLAAAAVAIGHMLREFGTGEYVISEKNLTQEKLRAAYAVTLLTALMIAGVLLLVAQPLARSYKEPGIATILYLLSVNFVLLPLGSMAFAKLSKELAFDKIFWIQTAAALAAAAVTVGAAWAGLTYLSPALGSIAGIVVTVMWLGLIRPHDVFMRPGIGGLRSVLRFGGVMTLTRLVDQIASRSVDFIISAMLGFHASGLFSKAFSLQAAFNDFFSSAIVRVATPALARAQGSEAAMRKTYIDTTVLLALVQFLFFGLLVVFGWEVIFILFGATWLEALPVLQLGAVSGLIWAPFMLSGSVLTVTRSLRALLTIQLAAAPILVACIYFGAQHSIEAVAGLWILAVLCRLVMISRALKTCCGLSTRVLLRALWPSLFVAGLAVIAALASKLMLLQLDSPAVVRLLAGVFCAVLVTGLGVVLTKHPLRQELQRLLQSRRAAAPNPSP
jgi:O-antigen/teichoic acid export membrane protein